MEALPFIGWLILMGFILSPLFAAFSEASKFDKKIKKLEKSRKNIRDITITVEFVSEKKPEPSPCQESKWLASSPSSPTGMVIACPRIDGSRNATASSLPHEDPYSSTSNKNILP